MKWRLPDYRIELANFSIGVRGRALVLGLHAMGRRRSVTIDHHLSRCSDGYLDSVVVGLMIPVQ